jgi:hypothetical protein
VLRFALSIWLMLGLVVGLAMPARHARAEDAFCAAAVGRYALAPDSRDVLPVAVQHAEGATNAERLLMDGAGSTVIQKTGGNSAMVVLDFGQNVSGVLRIAVAGSSGAELRVAVSESLQFLGPGSDVTFGEQHTYGWPLTGGAEQVETGQITFRYAMLFLTTDSTVNVESVRLHFTPYLGTPDTYAGCFESSDDLLNRIWYSGVYTLEMNTVETPDGSRILDGAKRDRDVWIGDLALEARIEYLTHNEPDAIRDSLAEMADRQRPDGTIPPSSFMDYSLILYDYTAWWVAAFGEYVGHTGDRAFAEKYYSAMVTQLDWFAGHTNQNGLVYKDSGIEWAHTLGRSGEVTYLNAVYYHALQQAASVAGTLGKHDDAATWRARADGIREAMNRRLYDPARGVYVDSDQDRTHIPQDGNALAVLFGIAPPAWQQGILDYMRQHMWTPYGSTNVDIPYGHNLMHDKRIWPFMGYYELEARFEAGDDASAFELLRREWGHMITSDPASTMWEWMTADGQPENGYDSLAHGWSAGATATLTERVVGVRMTAPEYTRFDVVPHTGDLTWARGRVPTTHGPIDVTWSRTADTFRETLRVPDGTTARAGVPLVGATSRIFVDDRLIWDGSTPIDPHATADGRYVYLDLSPGTHEIEATTRWVWFPETGEYLRSAFKGFWDGNGGLPVFGYPLTAQAQEGAFQAQYFERQRFEYHPENTGTPYEVLLGLLGSEEAQRRDLLDTAPFQPIPRPADSSDCWYAPETGQQTCGRFRAYWQSHGLDFGDDGISYRESLALFGYPISGEFPEQNPDTGEVYTVQYFERARFEYHPENAGSQYEVLLGRVGATAWGDG